MKIPVSQPDLSGQEEAYVLEAVRSSWISSSGKFLDRFEAEFAAIIGAPFCAATSNGTVSLHLALAALGIGPGDEVIVPSFGYIAVANAVTYVGATPRFVDIDEATWCIDPSLIEAAIGPATRAIIAVHNYGHCSDMDAITAIARRHRLNVVEDAAEAHFATYKGRMAGALGDIATFSFYGNKVISSGEGGAITCRDEHLDKNIRLLRSQGMDPKRRYFHPVIGYNFRLTNVACALLCAQLERRRDMLEARNAVFAQYRAKLNGVAGLSFQPCADWATISPWMFCMRVDPRVFGCDRDEFAARLARRGIETRPFFVPMHAMPPYAHLAPQGGLPVSERLANDGINLPTFVGLKPEEIDRVCHAVVEASRGP